MIIETIFALSVDVMGLSARNAVDPEVDGVEECTLAVPAENGGPADMEDLVEEADLACIGYQKTCNPKVPSCCPGLGCLPGLYGGTPRCVELGCVNGEYPCGPDSPNTVCCSGVCAEKGDGSYKCYFF
mgnify:CR=1